jgi:GNAT superfamily N-acetyltransferase
MAWDAEEGRRFWRNPDNLLLVARWEGEVCGSLTPTGCSASTAAGPRSCSTRSASASPSSGAWGGRALVEGAKRWAAEVGTAELWVLTEADNAPALALYRRRAAQRTRPARRCSPTTSAR